MTDGKREVAVEVHLEPEEAELLRELLDGISRDLSFEIADTDNSQFKETLRVKRAAVGKILDGLGGHLPDEAKA